LDDKKYSPVGSGITAILLKTGQTPQHENLAFPVFFASRRKRGASRRGKASKNPLSSSTVFFFFFVAPRTFFSPPDHLTAADKVQNQICKMSNLVKK